MRTFRWLLAGGVGLVLAAGFVSCGGSSTQTSIPATGGELCTPDRHLCLEIPAQAIPQAQTFRIFFPSTDRPGAQLSEVWDIEAVDNESFRFLKPATIRVRLDAVDMTNVRDDTLLRVYTSRDGTWEVLGNLFFDRVRNELRGTTSVLSTSALKRAVSAFTIMRVDRLPDGGIPIETDAGPLPDSGVIIIPPVPDAGRPDAGRPDSGIGGGSAGGGSAGGGSAGGGSAAGGSAAGGSAAGGSAAGGSAAGGSAAGGSAAGGSAAGGSAAGGSAAGGSAAGGSAAGGSAAGGSAAGGSAAGGSAAGGSAAGGSAAGGSAAGGSAAGGSAAGGSAAGGSAAGGSAAGGSAAGGSAAGGSAAGGSAAGGSAAGGSAGGGSAGGDPDGGVDGG